jgi:RimJ/RimL family protein N-acetyltransferase
MELSRYLLENGAEVVVRPIRPDDKERLCKAFALLTPETVHKRFLAPKKRLTSAELKYLTEIDGTDHVAVIAVMAQRPEIVVGVGRFVRLPAEPEAADVAIVIGDPWQHQGLGRHLGAILADLAREQGIRRFVATLLSDNLAAHRLFARISSRLRSHHSHGVEELVADLAA